MAKVHVEFLEATNRESTDRLVFGNVSIPVPANAEEGFVQLCLEELSDVGIPFPTNLRIGEKEILRCNDDIKITLRRMDSNSYRFFYCSYLNGHGTTFNSALFSAEIT
ncbi:MAG: hypothetical protein IJX99_03335 [Clostridia bacterium]|nr:hypothetical protein [Clostridia bacterium]